MRHKTKTIDEFASEGVAAIVEGIESLSFVNLMVYTTCAIQYAQRLNLTGASKRDIVIKIHSIISDRFLSGDERDLAEFFINHQLPGLIDQIIRLTKAKEFIKKRCF